MSGDPAFTLPPALEFMRGLWQLNHALERLSKRMEVQLGVTAQQRMIIRCIGHFPDVTSAELARQLHLDPGTISIALGRLEKKGLVLRRKSPGDRRRVNLRLSSRGRALDHPTKATVELAVEKLFAVSSPRAITNARGVLRELTRQFEAETDR